MFLRINKSSQYCPAAAVVAVAVLALERGAIFAADGPALVWQIKVLPDKAPDCSSLKSMVETATRGCKTNDAHGCPSCARENGLRGLALEFATRA